MNNTTKYLGLWMILIIPLVANDTSVPFNDINTAFGVPIFNSDNLWEEKPEEIAKRLNWPEESKTEYLSSYRCYAKKEALVLGCRPYSLVLQAEKDKPSIISIIFINKGDYEPFLASPNNARGFKMIDPKTIKEFGAVIRKEAEEVEKNITAVLGQGKGQNFGLTSSTMETVKRWDWNGHTILLASPKEDYVGIRIMPTEVAENNGRSARITKADLLEELSKRIIRRDNGDVVISGIPMVDQGPKGYCVPATWERYLRFLGIPADMYLLAMSANTMNGGGTSINGMILSMKSYVARYGRNIENVAPDFTQKNLSQYIDKGFPYIWCVQITEEIEKTVLPRNKKRSQAQDWNEWKTDLSAIRENYKARPYTPGDHVRMIIGYNAETAEIAYTDSWGQKHQEKWITTEEANYMTRDYFSVIRW